MTNRPKIHGVIVNHNTSQFVELVIRSLFETNDMADVDLSLAVLDNGSNDSSLSSLTMYLSKHHIPLVQTGFDTEIDAEKHPATLKQFITQNKDCTHYLFLDCDIWFEEQDTIPTMVAELQNSPPSIFANQTRIYGHYAEKVIEGREGIAGEEGKSEFTWKKTHDKQPYTVSLTYRCSPVCCLVSNIPTFRKVVEVFGLNAAEIYGIGKTSTYYDTFALLTHVMATHGLSYIVSSKTVKHFTNTVWCPQWREIRDKECMRMLTRLRQLQGYA